jgi:hypothetical protein
MKSISRALVRGFLAVALVVVAGSCSSSKSTPPPGTKCVVNSDCNNPLSCSFGTCHQECKEARDCPNGALCTKGGGGNVCLLPVEDHCALNSDCPMPLVCARDLKCRQECNEDRDCATRTQKCVANGMNNVCAEPADVDPANNTLKPPSSGVGGAGGGAAGGAGGRAGSGPDGGATPDGSSMMAGDGPASTTPIPVDAVMVDHPIVRQGEVGIMLTVTAPSGLSNASDATVGECRATIQDNTDTMLTLRVSCPHGVPLGPKDLKFQTPKGVGTKAGVITISAITSSPMGKDTNRGTSAEPYRTFKKALSVSDSGDTIQLMDGMYDKDGGEDFKDPIPSKLTIIGQSAAGTKLIGPSDTSIYVDAIKLREAGDLTIKSLTLGFFQHGINLDKQANLTLDNVKVIRSRTQGVYIYTGADNSKVTWTGDDSEISDHGQQAVYIGAKGVTFSFKSKGTISSASTYQAFTQQGDLGVVELEGATLSLMSPMGQALSLYNGTNYQYTVTLTNVTLNGSLDIGGKDKTTATITGSNIKLPSGYTGTGFEFTGAKLTLNKTTFTGGGTALHLNSGEVTVRNTNFNDYYYYGVQVSTVKTLDLGTAMQPGANAFVSGTNPNSFAIFDQRPADPNPITVSETTVDGNLLPAGTVTGPVNMPKRWSISTAKNTIVVY